MFVRKVTKISFRPPDQLVGLGLMVLEVVENQCIFHFGVLWIDSNQHLGLSIKTQTN